MKKLSFISFLLGLSMMTYANAPTLLNSENPTLHIDFDECVSWFNGYNEDYSEFTGISEDIENCGSIELAGPGYVYRQNGRDNTHSCTPGIDSTSLAMCISGMDACAFEEDSEVALRFHVQVNPGISGMASIEEISFYEQAPDTFYFYQGGSGLNNYPTLYGIRVLLDGEEVFRQDSIPTGRDWNLHTYSFSDIEAFTVTDTTIFDVEILPYCLIGNASPVQAWDIDNLSISAGCNSLNAGFVKVIGDVNICPTDTTSGVLTFEVENAFGSNSNWIVSNAMGQIIEILDSNTIDFDTIPNGLFSIYHIVYGDDIEGLEIGGDITAISGCFDISSRVVVVNNQLEAGELIGVDSTILFQICNQDSLNNLIGFELVGAEGLQTNFVVLDDSLNIVDVSLFNTIDFTNRGPGLYSIIAITHNGQLINAAPGNTINDIVGCYVSSNRIFVNKEVVEGGILSLLQDEFCVNDGTPDLIDPVLENNLGAFSTYVLTDPNGNVLNVIDTFPFDLEGAAEGQCVLWHIASTNRINIEAEVNINDFNPDVCIDFSNGVEFTRSAPDAGMVTYQDNTGSVTICVSDSLSDVLVFSNSNISIGVFEYVITDTSNVVISVSQSDSIDFSGADIGICRVWGLSHDGGLLLEEGDAVNDSIFIGQCASLSRNFIEVIRVDSGVECGEVICNVDGGFIDLFGSIYCVGDGSPDFVTGDVQGAIGEVQQIIVTDSDSIILNVYDSLNFDVDMAPAGMCIVWNVSSTDSLNIQLGTSIQNIDGDCFDLSSGASFNRILNNGGFVSLGDSITRVEVCVGDSIPDVLSFETSGEGVDYIYIVTDTANVILALPDSTIVNFENTNAGICRVWGLAHNSTFMQVVGDTLEEPSVNGRCFDLSENFVEVTRLDNGGPCGDEPECDLQGGLVNFVGGALTASVCVDDTTNSVVSLENTGSGFTNYFYILTDTNNIVQAVSLSNSFDFLNVNPGICRIYGLARDGGNAGIENDGVFPEGIDSTLCFSVSENFVTVIKDECIQMMVSAGMISLNDGTVEFCPGDSTGIMTVGGPTKFLFSSLQNFRPIHEVNLDGDIYPDFIFMERNSFNWVEYDPIDPSNLKVTPLIHDLPHSFGVNAVGDLDGDGDLDIVVAAFGIDEYDFYLLTNDGSNNFSSSEILDGTWNSNTSTPSEVEIFDIDGDSDLDFVALNTIPNPNFERKIVAYINDGIGSFTLQEIDTGTSYTGIALSDFDSNGQTDLIVMKSNFSEDSLFMFTNLITDNTKTVIDPNLSDDFLANGDNFVSVSDVDKDGDDDIFLFNSINANFIYLNKGNGEFDKINIQGNPQPQTDIKDFDGDGDLDYTTRDGVLINDGALNFTLQEFDFGLNNLNAHVIISDIDGNGTQDLINSAGEWFNIQSGGYSFEVDLTGATGSENRWLLTNAQGIIVQIDDTDPPLIYDLVPEGAFFLYNVSYNGSISGLEVGQALNGISGDFALSNTVVLNSSPCIVECDVDGGFIDLFNSSFCVGDSIADFVTGDIQGSEGDVQQIIVTNVDSVILEVHNDLGFDVDTAPEGTCIVWNVSSNDTLDLMAGMHIDSIQSECYDMSQGASFTRVINTAGAVSITNGSVSDTICAGDNIQDPIAFANTGSVSENYQYVITNSQNSILALPLSNSVNFDVLPFGECRVYGVAYSGSFILEVGDSLEVMPSTNACFSISENFVTVVKEDCSPMTSAGLSIVVNRIGESSQIFDIKNISNDTIDVSDYWVCLANNAYTRLGAAILECGSFSTIMAPGDVNGINLSVNNVDGQIAIYKSDQFADPSQMIHFVEWGSSGHGRTNEAVMAGLWTAGDFVPAIAAGQSSYFSGMGYSSESWTEGETSLCGELVVGSDIVFNRVGDGGFIIDLKNIGTESVDVSDYVVVQGTTVVRVGDQIVSCGAGSRILGPGDKIGFMFLPVMNASGELALFSTEGSFGFSGPVLDYVQWGASGQSLEGRAVNDGQWSMSDFVPSITAGMSIYYDGEGNSSSDWTEGTTNICGDALPNTKRIAARISPNPAVDELTIKIMKTQKPVTQISISDGSGKVLIQLNGMNMESFSEYRMGINNLSPGIYFLRMKSKNAVVTERFMVIK